MTREKKKRSIETTFEFFFVSAVNTHCLSHKMTSMKIYQRYNNDCQTTKSHTLFISLLLLIQSLSYNLCELFSMKIILNREIMRFVCRLTFLSQSSFGNIFKICAAVLVFPFLSSKNLYMLSQFYAL